MHPKYSFPDVLSADRGISCDIASVGTLRMIFQVIYLNVAVYMNCIWDFQSISQAFYIHRHHLPASLRAIYTGVLAIAAPSVAAVSAAETTAPPVTIENFAAPGNKFLQLSHCSSPPQPRCPSLPAQAAFDIPAPSPCPVCSDEDCC